MKCKTANPTVNKGYETTELGIELALLEQDAVRHDADAILICGCIKFMGKLYDRILLLEARADTKRGDKKRRK